MVKNYEKNLVYVGKTHLEGKIIPSQYNDWFPKYSLSNSNFENMSKFDIFYFGDPGRIVGILDQMKPN